MLDRMLIYSYKKCTLDLSLALMKVLFSAVVIWKA